MDLSSLQLVSELLQAVYIGCESCAKILIQVRKYFSGVNVCNDKVLLMCLSTMQDENDIYCPCFECMVKQPGGVCMYIYVKLVDLVVCRMYLYVFC